MELQLASQPGQAGQGGDGAQFAFFAVEHVTGEDVRKKMFLQKGIDDRGKGQDAGRGLDLLLSAKVGPDTGAVRLPVQVRRQGRGGLSFGVRDAPGTALLQDFHEDLQPVQAAGKADVGIQMGQDFLDLIDAQPGIQRLVQGRAQAVQIAAGGVGGHEHHALLPPVKAFCRAVLRLQQREQEHEDDQEGKKVSASHGKLLEEDHGTNLARPRRGGNIRSTLKIV